MLKENSMKILYITILFILFSSMSIAHADNELTQTDLNQAASQSYKSSDFMLNKAYSQLMRALDKERQNKLKISQRAWIKFRDLEAELISSAYAGGSISPLIQARALTELTNQRTSQLTKLYLIEITP
jgi:uncharacterized protein YecT (DUF1311 family)